MAVKPRRRARDGREKTAGSGHEFGKRAAPYSARLIGNRKRGNQTVRLARRSTTGCSSEAAASAVAVRVRLERKVNALGGIHEIKRCRPAQAARTHGPRPTLHATATGDVEFIGDRARVAHRSPARACTRWDRPTPKWPKKNRPAGSPPSTIMNSPSTSQPVRGALVVPQDTGRSDLLQLFLQGGRQRRQASALCASASRRQVSVSSPVKVAPSMQNGRM